MRRVLQLHGLSGRRMEMAIPDQELMSRPPHVPGSPVCNWVPWQDELMMSVISKGWPPGRRESVKALVRGLVVLRMVGQGSLAAHVCRRVLSIGMTGLAGMHELRSKFNNDDQKGHQSPVRGWR